MKKYMRTGTYVHVSGPSYESPSEIGLMRKVGGDSVGMSTVPEVVAAAHTGLSVLGLSLITNKCLAPGDTTTPPTHEEVLEATAQRASEMQALVANIVAKMDPKALPPTPAEAYFGPAGPGAAAVAAAAAQAKSIWNKVPRPTQPFVTSSLAVISIGVSLYTLYKTRK